MSGIDLDIIFCRKLNWVERNIEPFIKLFSNKKSHSGHWCMKIKELIPYKAKN